MKKSLFLSICLSLWMCLPTMALTRWTFDSKANLIQSADQFSVNAIQIMDGCSLANLLDKDGDTWFHSAWTTDNGSPLPNADHYLQVHLTEAKQHIIFTYIGMNWPSAHNSPQEVTVYATSTPADESSWVKVTKLTDMIPIDNYPVSYTSPHLDLGAAYTDVRFEVNQTTTGKVEGTYRRHYFCLSEFGLFEAVEEEVNNLVQTADQLSTNSIEIMTGCSLANLLDGNGDTWYHSAWNTVNDSPLPDADHYLQAHLLEPVEDFFFTYLGMNWPSAHNSPDDVAIYATNTPDDESSWKLIETLTDMVVGDDYPVSYTSPAIHLGAPYTDLRFVVTQTTTGAVEGTYNRHYFCLSEFGIYLGEPKRPDPLNLIFIGNSITYGATLQNASAPPIKVGRMLEEELGRPVDVYNCGVSGATTLDFLPASGSYYAAVNTAIKKAMASGGPIVFSMMLGTNDSAETGPNGSPVKPENYFMNMRVIIDQVLNSCPHAVVIVNYPIWYSPNTYNGARYLQAGLDRLQSYHPEIDRLVSYYAKMQAPHQRVFTGNPEVFSFFADKTELFTPENGYQGVFYLHPNATGGTRLAEFWKQSIIDHLGATDFSSPADYAPELIDSALAVVGQCFVTSTQSSTYLINEASQITSNALQAATGTLDLLIDKKPATWFETDATTADFDEPHYLQFDLLTDTLQRVALRMIRRPAVGGKHTDNHLPNNIAVYATNDTTASGQWTLVARLTDGFPVQTQNKVYISPAINLLQPSRYVRMVVNGNVSGALSAAGRPYFNLGEVQVYPVTVKQDESPYYVKRNGLAQACDILQDLCRESLLQWQAGTFTDADALTLRQAMAVVTELLEQPWFEPADVNHDGVIDSADIVAVIKEMPDGDNKADVNADNVIDSADIVAVIKAMK